MKMQQAAPRLRDLRNDIQGERKDREADLQIGPASYLFSAKDGSHFLDQETYETISLSDEMIGEALEQLIEGR